MVSKDDLITLCEEHGISSHTAKGPIFIRFPDGVTYISFDKKSSQYPNKNFVDKMGFWGGNWNKVDQHTPEDLFRTEVSEEISSLSNLVNQNYHLFREYFTQIPQVAHGNPKRGIFLNPVTLFVVTLDGIETLDALKLPKNFSREMLHQAISDSSDFKYSGLISLDEITKGKYSNSPEFAWGDEVMLMDVLRAEYGIKADIARNPNIIVEPLDDVPLNMPYKDRWSIQYDRLNPIKKGNTRDSMVFE